MPTLRAPGPKASVLAAAMFVPFLGSAPATAGTYQVDDGSCEGAVTTNHPQGAIGTYVWLTRYGLAPGMETITDISVMFGRGPEHNGLSMEALLWKCSPSNPAPQLATLVSRAPGVVANMSPLTGPMNQIRNTYDIPDVTLLPGEKFYIGVIVYDVPSLNGQDFAKLFAVDTSNSDGGGYLGLKAGPIDPANLASLNGNEMIRSSDHPGGGTGLGTLMLTANGVPAPGAAPILAMGLIALSRRRR